MTPLNSIINTSQICGTKMQELYNFISSQKDQLSKLPIYENLVVQRDMNMKMISAVR